MKNQLYEKMVYLFTPEDSTKQDTLLCNAAGSCQIIKSLLWTLTAITLALFLAKFCC